MALITTNASPIRLYNAFTGLSALERSQSGIARAEVIYYGNESWAAPGAGNNRIFQIPQTTLPKDFGYVVTDFFVNVKTNAVSDAIATEANAAFRVFPGGVLGPQIQMQLQSDPGRMDSAATTQIGSLRADQYNASYPVFGERAAIQYTLRDKYTGIIYPFSAQTYTTTSNPGSIFDFCLSEQKVNGDEYQVQYCLRFLQYDIDQSYNYVIQSPQLTRG